MKKINLIYMVVLSVLILVSCGDTTSSSGSTTSSSGNEKGTCEKTYAPTDKVTLKANIDTLYNQCGGNSASYSLIDVSAITDMSELFKGNTNFNGDISGWDISGVTNVNSMFEGATKFNQDLSGWKLKAGIIVKDSSSPTKMFYKSGIRPKMLPTMNFYQYSPTDKAALQADIVAEIAKQGDDEADLSIIDTSKVTDMRGLFSNNNTFNGYISTWDMSGVENVSSMFENATNFNQDLSGWVLKAGVIAKDSSSPTKMFYKSGIRPKMLPTMNFYQYSPTDNEELKTAIAAEIAKQGDGADLSIIDTSQVTDMSSLFEDNATFNGYVATWDTSKVENMNGMFVRATAFNQPIGDWDTSQVKTMFAMFLTTDNFNQPIGNWNTGSVTNMESMFNEAKAFNQPIGNWKTGSVTKMKRMFRFATAFDQPLKDWDTSNVTTFQDMFARASAFNQNLTAWKKGVPPPGEIINIYDMFQKATAMKEDNKADWMPANN